MPPTDLRSPDLPSLLARLEREGWRLGLDSMRSLLAALGSPERAAPSVLVGGTNGKGSTSALLAAIATAAGYRSGLYTSPHLESAEERIRVDGAAIAPDALEALLREVVAAGERANGATPTYFEAFTAAAFLHFARADVELAVLEVGLGGRLDATNTAEPLLSVVTSIDRDHEAQLGSTLSAIAGEKAGIFRRRRPVLAWAASDEARATLAERAAALDAPLTWRDAASTIEGAAPTSVGQRVRLRTASDRYTLDLALAGAHQHSNLALAVLAAESLAATGFARIDAAAIAAGVARCRWPGRIERVELGEAGSGRAVILDAAHNPAGVEALLAHLDARGGGYDLLFGALADKDVAAMLPPLASRARRVVLTRPASPRAADPAELAALVDGALVEPEPRAALARALDLSLGAEPAGDLVVCGSIYLLGEARTALRARYGVPPPATAPLF